MRIEWDDILIFVASFLAVILACFLVACAVDAIGGHAAYEEGAVIEKVFSPGKVGTGVGPTVGGHGGVAVVVTATSDEWHVLVQTNKDVIDAETSKVRWISLKVGDKVKVRHWVGWLSKNVWSSRLAEDGR